MDTLSQFPQQDGYKPIGADDPSLYKAVLAFEPDRVTKVWRERIRMVANGALNAVLVEGMSLGLDIYEIEEIQAAILREFDTISILPVREGGGRYA